MKSEKMPPPPPDLHGYCPVEIGEHVLSAEERREVLLEMIRPIQYREFPDWEDFLSAGEKMWLEEF